MPHALGAEIDQHHGEHDQQQHGADVAVVELTDGLEQILANAAGADEPHDGGTAHIDLEPEEAIAGEVRQDLRENREPHRLNPSCPSGDDTLDRLEVDVLDDFGKELTEGPGRVYGDC